MVGGTVGFLLWSIREDGWRQSVLVELGITCLGILITVFYVDIIQRRHEEQRWAGTKAVATTRLKRIATRLIHDTTELFPRNDQPQKFPLPYWWVRAYPDGSYWREFYENPEWLDYVKNEVIPATPALMEQLSSESLVLLAKLLRLTSDDLKDVVTVFPGALSPGQLQIITTMMGEIRTETGLISYRRGQAPNRHLPNPAGILQHSLALIAEQD